MQASVWKINERKVIRFCSLVVYTMKTDTFHLKRIEYVFSFLGGWYS